MTTGYAEHVHHGMLTYPPARQATGVGGCLVMPGGAWEQIGAQLTDHLGVMYCGVRGIDGREYVAEGVSPGAWRIVRAGHYGLGAVTHGHTLKAAVQRLNAFHVGETCDHCGHVNSERGHGCESCGRIRYALRYEQETGS
jgi:hypothetical protein